MRIAVSLLLGLAALLLSRARSGVPVVDLAPLLALRTGAASAETREQARAAAEQVLVACREWGFFHVVNHGLDSAEAMAQCRRFFAQPTDWKLRVERSAVNGRGFTNREFTKQRVDLKEVFDFGHKPRRDLADDAAENVVADGWNQFPREEELPQFRACMDAYYERCAEVAEVLLGALGERLAGDASAWKQLAGDHTSFMRLNFYPQTPPESSGSLGISRHTDAGILTVLTQDTVPGLEVYSGSKEDRGDGAWEPVDPVPGALTINAGDMLQVWSNGALKAAEHRVRASARGAPRFSIALFYNPAYASMVAPLASDQRPQYRPINWGEFRARRFEGDYADAGREVQIEDFAHVE